MQKVLQEVLHSTLTMTHSQRPYLSYASVKLCGGRRGIPIARVRRAFRYRSTE